MHPPTVSPTVEQTDVVERRRAFLVEKVALLQRTRGQAAAMRVRRVAACRHHRRSRSRKLLRIDNHRFSRHRAKLSYIPSKLSELPAFQYPAVSSRAWPSRHRRNATVGVIGHLVSWYGVWASNLHEDLPADDGGGMTTCHKSEDDQWLCSIC